MKSNNDKKRQPAEEETTTKLDKNKQTITHPSRLIGKQILANLTASFEAKSILACQFSGRVAYQRMVTFSRAYGSGSPIGECTEVGRDIH